MQLPPPQPTQQATDRTGAAPWELTVVTSDNIRMCDADAVERWHNAITVGADLERLARRLMRGRLSLPEAAAMLRSLAETAEQLDVAAAPGRASVSPALHRRAG